jgi:hypothetical protein
LPTIDESTGIDSTEVAAVEGTEPVIASEFVKICVGNGHPSFPNGSFVDVPIACLQKQTNTRSIIHACAMLDICFAMEAVQLFVVVDDRLSSRPGCSSYRAIPVIDTKVMFAALSRVRTVEKDFAMVAVVSNGVEQVDPDGNVLLERIDLHDNGDDTDNEGDGSSGRYLTLSTGIEYDDGILELTVKVDDENTSITRPTSICAQQNVALAVVGPGVATSKGYAFSFSVKCASDDSRNVDGILTGLINRVGGGGAGGISRKRKAIPMQ